MITIIKMKNDDEGNDEDNIRFIVCLFPTDNCSNAHHNSNYELMVKIESLKLQLHSGTYTLVTIITLQSGGAFSSRG